MQQTNTGSGNPLRLSQSGSIEKPNEVVVTQPTQMNQTQPTTTAAAVSSQIDITEKANSVFKAAEPNEPKGNCQSAVRKIINSK